MPKNNQVRVLTKKDIEELSGERKNKGIFFSLYLGIRPDRSFASVANSIISSAIYKIKKSGKFSLNLKEKRKILDMAEKAKKKIRLLKLPKGTRSIAMFCNASGASRIYHIPAYIPSKIIIENDFYIHPLVQTLEEHPRYIVVALERDKARFFDISLGKMEEISEVIHSDVPQRINAARAAWKGLRETKVQRHIEDHLQRHLHKTAKAAKKYFQKNGASYLVVGAHRELVERFKNALDKKILDKVIGSYHIVPGYKLNRIKEKSEMVIDEYEKGIELKIVENLLNKASKRKSLAVLGLNLVLENLYLQNIDTIVLSIHYKETGYECHKCHYLSSYLRTCPKCGIEMSRMSDIADEIIEKAIVSKIKIKHLFFSHSGFDKFGIGAFLKKVL